MMEGNTSKMPTQTYKLAPGSQMSFADFAKECYLDSPDKARAQQEGWWQGILEAITVQEVRLAINEAKANTAPGESQVTVDMLKLFEGDLEPMADMFNRFKAKGRVPDEMNTAMLRLLPKTSVGLADLDKTRPIALMETIGKLYERIMITRVTERIAKHKVVDVSQYGALPEAGVAAPVRMTAEVMEDAVANENELHLVMLDLKKAFDTCEYWSQALSWHSLGMPEHMIRILINMDAGSNSPADPYEGKGATTKVILDAGHTTEPFAHGRGVRQGSVGGPIKWVVFMHFWMTWVKRSMAGKGYTMQAHREHQMGGPTQTTIGALGTNHHRCLGNDRETTQGSPRGSGGHPSRDSDVHR